MKRFTVLLGIAALLCFATFQGSDARGRGGGGLRGGGGFRGGGGAPRGGFSGAGRSMSRPSISRPSPSINRSPSVSRPNVSRPSSRPSSGSRPSIGSGSRPSIGSRPSPGAGTRPGLTPGTRPNIGSGGRPGIADAGRPGLTPGTRPGIGAGTRPGVGERPGIGTRPGVGERPGIGTRPGVGERPGIGTRPGLGAGTGIAAGAGVAATLPGLGEGSRLTDRRSQFQDRFNNRQDAARDRWQNRPENRQQRRNDLQNRLDSRLGSRQDRLGSRQDFRQQARHDWQNWADNHYWHHYHWNHGAWYPGTHWDYMWSNYPGWTAFRTTVWGVNRLAWTFGYWGYSNPYYTSGSSVVYNYSQPIVTYQEPQEAAASSTAADLPPGATEQGVNTFDAARSAFHDGDYQTALTEADKTLREMPHDAVVHEFRALVLFALGRYDEAAATIYAVLAVGPGWDWTTLSGLYADVDTYTQQLRALEAYVKQHPDSSQAHFLLAYQYLTCQQQDAAVNQLKEVLKLTPGQKVATDMLTMIEGPEAVESIQGAGQPVLPPPAGIDAPAVKPQQIRGSWKAAGPDDSRFELTLNEDGSFNWRFTREGQKSQDVQGVWALDGHTLAMEPDTGGTMLAELSDVSDAGFTFRMAGSAPDDAGLQFQH